MTDITNPAPIGASSPATYAPLPSVGAIGYASVVDIHRYAKILTIGPHLPGVRDVALWTSDQMRDFADRTFALRLSRGQAPAPARDLQAVIKTAADKLDAAKRCHPSAVDTLIEEALEILDGDREPTPAAPAAQGDALIQQMRQALESMLEYAGVIEERWDTVATDAARSAVAAARAAKEGDKT